MNRQKFASFDSSSTCGPKGGGMWRYGQNGVAAGSMAAVNINASGNNYQNYQKSGNNMLGAGGMMEWFQQAMMNESSDALVLMIHNFARQNHVDFALDISSNIVSTEGDIKKWSIWAITTWISSIFR